MNIETCPICGHDLVDVSLTSLPVIPKKSCFNCGWSWTGKPEEVARIPFAEGREKMVEHNKPKTDIEGLKRSSQDLLEAAFKKGVKMGRYLEQQNARAADAVRVVRCKDCVLWRPVDKHTGKCPFLIGKHQYTGDDHYCSCGERREENEG